MGIRYSSIQERSILVEMGGESWRGSVDPAAARTKQSECAVRTTWPAQAEGEGRNGKDAEQRVSRANFIFW